MSGTGPGGAGLLDDDMASALKKIRGEGDIFDALENRAKDSTAQNAKVLEAFKQQNNLLTDLLMFLDSAIQQQEESTDDFLTFLDKPIQQEDDSPYVTEAAAAVASREVVVTNKEGEEEEEEEEAEDVAREEDSTDVAEVLAAVASGEVVVTNKEEEKSTAATASDSGSDDEELANVCFVAMVTKEVVAAVENRANEKSTQSAEVTKAIKQQNSSLNNVLSLLITQQEEEAKSSSSSSNNKPTVVYMDENDPSAQSGEVAAAIAAAAKKSKAATTMITALSSKIEEAKLDEKKAAKVAADIAASEMLIKEVEEEQKAGATVPATRSLPAKKVSYKEVKKQPQQEKVPQAVAASEAATPRSIATPVAQTVVVAAAATAVTATTAKRPTGGWKFVESGAAVKRRNQKKKDALFGKVKVNGDELQGDSFGLYWNQMENDSEKFFGGKKIKAPKWSTTRDGEPKKISNIRSYLPNVAFNGETKIKLKSGVHYLTMTYQNPHIKNKNGAQHALNKEIEAAIIVGEIVFDCKGYVLAQGADWDKLFAGKLQLKEQSSNNKLKKWYSHKVSEPWQDGDTLTFKIDTIKNTIGYTIRGKSKQGGKKAEVRSGWMFANVLAYTNNRTFPDYLQVFAYCGGKQSLNNPTNNKSSMYEQCKFKIVTNDGTKERLVTAVTH